MSKQAFLDKIFRPDAALDTVPANQFTATEDEDSDQGEDSEGSGDNEPDRSAYEELEHTKRSRADNPIYRASFWVFVIGLTATALMGFASQMNLSMQSTENRYTTPVDEPEPEDEAVALDEQETRVAFAEQDAAQANAESLLEAESRAKAYDEASNKANAAANNTAATPPQSRSVPRTPSPANTVQVPRRAPVTPRRQAYTPRPTPPVSRPRPVQTRQPVQRKPAKSTPTPAPPAQSAPEQNPTQLYASFNDIGSYGSANWTGGKNQGASASGFTDQSASTSDNFLGGDVYLSPGESVELELALPIVWSESREAPKTLATVTKGTKYLPVGTQVAVTSSGDNSGIVQITQLALIDGQETIPLSGSMQITQPNGKPLKAKKKGGPGFFKKIGIKTLLGLGSSVASSALSGDSVTINTGSTSVTQDRGILSSALQSGSNELLSDLQQRSEAGVEQQQSQEYFLVESGKKFQVSAVSNVGG